MMCPKCDRWCPYWNYAAICYEVRASHMFDNGATVFFSVFISLWGQFISIFFATYLFITLSKYYSGLHNIVCINIPCYVFLYDLVEMRF